MNVRRAVDAMHVTFFHWGFHGWTFYVLAGLSLACFGYRKKLPLTLRSTLYPLNGERIHGPWGHAVDLLAVFARSSAWRRLLSSGLPGWRPPERALRNRADDTD